MARTIKRERQGFNWYFEGRQGHADSKRSKLKGIHRRCEIHSERHSTSSNLSQQRGLRASQVEDSLDNGTEAKRAFTFDKYNW